MGALYESYSDEELTDSIKQSMNDAITVPMAITTAYTARYFWNGWPKTVLSQSKRIIANRGKLKQTYIEWDTSSTGNF